MARSIDFTNSTLLAKSYVPITLTFSSSVVCRQLSTPEPPYFDVALAFLRLAAKEGLAHREN
jgi:hypothetical protein